MGRTVYQLGQNPKFWYINSNKELDATLQECRVSLKKHNYVETYRENKKIHN